MEFINPSISSLVLYKKEVEETLKESEALLTEQETEISKLKAELSATRSTLDSLQVEASARLVYLNRLSRFHSLAMVFFAAVSAAECVYICWRYYRG